MKHALRSLAKSPGFTAVAIVTIALGLGAGTAVFSLVNAVLLRTLPVPNPSELRLVKWTGSDVRMRSINRDQAQDPGPGHPVESVNHPTFADLRERAKSLADLFGFFPLRAVTAREGQHAFVTEGWMVSDNFFSGVGVQAWRGHLFAPGDDHTNLPQAVISYTVWQREFALDPAVIGRSISLHGIEHTIIGVLPPTFHGIRPGQEPDIYVPMIASSPFLYVPFTDDWHWFIRLMARVHPSTTDAQLASALTAVFAHDAAARMKEPKIVLEPGGNGLRFDREAYAQPLALMLGITALVMFVACANLAGLSLARGGARQRELAVRAALGAGRWRLLRESLTENFLLAAFGGALGLLVAAWARPALSRLLAGSPDGLHYDFSLDARVLGFSLAAVVVTTLLSGALPAWRASRTDPCRGLQSRGAAATPPLRWARYLVAIQLCIALGVLAAAGLGLRSLANLRRIDPGFDPANLLLFSVNPASAGYQGVSRIAYYDRLHDALNALPGVDSAALMAFRLLTDEVSSGGFDLPSLEVQPAGNRNTYRQMVDESFFATMHLPLVRGRGITRADDVAAPKVIVINEAFARRYFGDRDPLGHTMTMWGATWTIVGVCRDAKFDDLKSPAPPTTYFPFRQRFYDRFTATAMDSATFAVRSSLPPAALHAAIVNTLASIDPAVPGIAFTSQSALVDHFLGRERLLGNLGAALAGVVLLLCCIGVYGLIGYNVNRRRGEIAVRIALGAQSRDIARPILAEALTLAGIGLAAGLPVVFFVTRMVRHQLYGVDQRDPFTLLTAAMLLIAVAALAAALPVRRALRVDPIEALRAE